MIIAFEGADKAGKHTQVTKSMGYLEKNGIPTETLDFPQYKTRTGKKIKACLNGKTQPTRMKKMKLFAKDRKAQMRRVKRWLRKGKMVVFDRYTYSNVYSIAPLPREQWPDEVSKLENLEFKDMKIVPPDYTIYLSLPAEISYAMRNQGLKEYQNGKPDIHEADLELQTRVVEMYKWLAARDPAKWTVVNEIKPDGTRMNPDEVFACIRPILDEVILQYRRNHTK